MGCWLQMHGGYIFIKSTTHHDLRKVEIFWTYPNSDLHFTFPSRRGLTKRVHLLIFKTTRLKFFLILTGSNRSLNGSCMIHYTLPSFWVRNGHFGHNGLFSDHIFSRSTYWRFQSCETECSVYNLQKKDKREITTKNALYLLWLIKENSMSSGCH